MAIATITLQKDRRGLEIGIPLLSLFGALAVLALAFAFVVARRCFLSFRFADDFVTGYGVSGSALWSEPTETLLEFQTIHSSRGPGFVKLIWPHCVRTIPFDCWWSDLQIYENVRLAGRAGYRFPGA